MQKPVANMLGLTSAMENDLLDEEKIRLYSRHLKTVSEELDGFIRQLNDDYSRIRMSFLGAKQES